MLKTVSLEQALLVRKLVFFKLLGSCKERINREVKMGKRQCDCPETCKLVVTTCYILQKACLPLFFLLLRSDIFDTTISSLRWPSADYQALKSVCKTVQELIDKLANDSSTCDGMSYLRSQYEEKGIDEVLEELLDCKFTSMESEQFATGVVGKRFARVKLFYSKYVEALHVKFAIFTIHFS